MKKIGIICAMDNEFALIKQALAHGRTAHIGRCTFYCAEYAGKDIIAATGGIGKEMCIRDSNTLPLSYKNNIQFSVI